MSFFLDSSYDCDPMMPSSDGAPAPIPPRETARTVRELEVQLERALLASEAMWSILKEKFGLTDMDLARRVNDIDLTDGLLDGRVRRTPVSCPKCHRTISPRSPKCMYCGQAVVHKPFA